MNQAMNRARPPQAQGFTLLEVLVALAIVAIALGAAVRLSGEIINGTTSLKQHTLARWLAQNRINTLLAVNSWPSIGASDGDESMANFDFHWQQDVSNTPNQFYRRIEVRVYAHGDADFAIADLVTYMHESQN